MARPKLNAEDVHKAVAARKWHWIDAQLEKFLPREVYLQAHSSDNATAMKRMEELGYNVKFEPRGWVLLRKGNDVLAQAQFVIELDHEGLGQLAKSARIRQGGE